MLVQRTGFSVFEQRPDPRYRVVTTIDALQEMVNFLTGKPRFAFDFETSGLKWWRAFSCGIAFTSKDPNESWCRNYYVPYRHLTGQHQLPAEKVFEAIRPLFTPEVEVIAHNIKFDEHFLHNDGIRIRGPRHDTMIAAHLYDENRPLKLKHRGLTDLGDERAQLHEDMLSTDLTRLAKQAGIGVTEYKENYGFAGMDIYLLGPYAGHDTEMTWGLFHRYGELGIYDYYDRVYKTEMGLTEALCDMEEVGVPIDSEYMLNLYEHLIKERDIATGAFFKESGVEYFNLASDDELRHYLQKGLKLQLTQLTKSKKAYSVGVDVLMHFAQIHPHLRHVARQRDCDKKISTYTKTIVEQCDAHGILHCEFWQTGTNTGRLSCKDPNLQNITTDDEDRAEAAEDGIDPESIKRGFMVQRSNPPWKTKRTVRSFADYSQVELRVLARYTHSKRMVDTFQADGDIHLETEKAVFGTEGTNRRPAKVINFGLCVAGHQRVLTQQDGLVPLSDVKDWHLVWDGVEWVRHEGLVCRGEHEVVEYDGVEATPDHKVFTEDGRVLPIGDLASEVCSGRIATGAVGLVPFGYSFFDGPHWETGQREGSGGSLLSLLQAVLGFGSEYQGLQNEELYMPAREIWRPSREDFRTAVRCYGSALHEGYARILEALQRSWDQSLVQVARAFYPVGAQQVAGYGLQGVGLRSPQQRRTLFTEKPTFGRSIYKSPKRKTLVYDLINAGPRHRFTVEGKIVSNSYRMSPMGFSRQVGVSIEEAEKHFNSYNEKFPEVEAFCHQLWNSMRSRRDCGFENLFGRTRRIPWVASDDHQFMHRGRRQAIASLIQGTAADVMKETIVRVFQALRDGGFETRCTLTVHDELQTDGPVEEYAEVVRLKKKLAEDYADIFGEVPLKMDFEASTKSWAHKQEVKV